MEIRILKVVRQGEAFSVQSAKAEGGQIQKCTAYSRQKPRAVRFRSATLC